MAHCPCFEINSSRGGGDSAVEEASYLTKFASKVYLLVRKDQLRASKTMQQRAFDNEKMRFYGILKRSRRLANRY